MMKSSSQPNKTRILHGNRIGREGKVRVGCSVVLLNEKKDSVLLTRRSDNGQWCLPGGRVDPGESVAEASLRELMEETGLEGRLVRLIGVYSDPDQLIVYPDGEKAFVIVLSFEVQQTGGQLRLSPETTEARFVPVAEAIQMDLFHSHAQHIRDGLAARPETFIR